MYVYIYVCMYIPMYVYSYVRIYIKIVNINVLMWRRVMICVAACCSVLQRVAACCSVLQHVCIYVQIWKRMMMWIRCRGLGVATPARTNATKGMRVYIYVCTYISKCYRCICLYRYQNMHICIYVQIWRRRRMWILCRGMGVATTARANSRREVCVYVYA